VDTVGLAQPAYLQGVGVDAGEALIRAHPYLAGTVLHQHVDAVVGQAVGRRQAPEPAPSGVVRMVEDGDAVAVRGQPQAPLVIDEKRGHEAVRCPRAVGIVGRQPLHRLIVPAQPDDAAPGADPYGTVLERQQGGDAAFTQCFILVAQQRRLTGGRQTYRPYPVQSAQPQDVVLPGKRPDGRVRAAPGNLDPLYRTAVAVAVVQALLGAEVDAAVRRVRHREYPALGQRARCAVGACLELRHRAGARGDDAHGTAGDAQPYLAVRTGQYVINVEAAGGADRPHRRDAMRAGIVLAQRATGGNEDLAVTLAQHRDDLVAAQAVLHVAAVAQAPRRFLLDVDLDDAAALGAEPDDVGLLFHDRAHALALQGGLGALFHDGVGRHPRRADDEGAVGAGADPHAARAVLVQRADRRFGARSRAQVHDLRPGVVAGPVEQALARADPETALAVAQQRVHPARGQRGCRELWGAARGAMHVAAGVDAFQSRAGADPDAAGAVVDDAGNTCMVQAARTCRNGGEAVALGVIAGQAAGARADPQASARVHMHTQNVSVGQAAFVVGIGPVAPRPEPVPADQAGLRAQPDKTVAVLGNRCSETQRFFQVMSERHMGKRLPRRRCVIGGGGGREDYQCANPEHHARQGLAEK